MARLTPENARPADCPSCIVGCQRTPYQLDESEAQGYTVSSFLYAEYDSVVFGAFLR
jgi:hypothetical protein